MTVQSVEAILARATSEPEFRRLLFEQPVAALAGYDLSEAEINALSSLIHESFDAHQARLERRESNSAPSLNGALSELSSATGNTHATFDTTLF
jgi:hypothetical protein